MTDPGGAMTDKKLREAVITACRALVQRGLSYGTSGNVSVRRDERSFFVSPTGMPYDALEPDDIPLMDLDGRWFGRRRPSSEWRFHRDVLASRDEVAAIVHTHSPKATSLACTGRGIPAFHYMVAVAGGSDIRCAPVRRITPSVHRSFPTPRLRPWKAARRACLPITASSQWVQTFLRLSRSLVRSKTSPRNIARRWRSGRSAFSMKSRCAESLRSSARMANLTRRTLVSSLAAEIFPVGSSKEDDCGE